MRARARHSRAVFVAAPRSIMLLLAICLTLIAKTFAYDYASSCTRSFRSSRSHNIIKKIPCDLRKESYCALPGATYPWHAVRRFVHENQGLMRRMYGDQRHISVLQAEIDTNEVDDENVEPDSEQHLQKASALAEDIIKTKLLYANKPEGRSLDMKTVPYFRPVQTTSSPTIDGQFKLNSTKADNLVNKNKTKIINEANSDKIQNETSDEDVSYDYDKTMFYKDGLKDIKLQTTANVEVNNNVEPEIITLEAIIKQTIESNSVYPKYESDYNKTNLANKTRPIIQSNNVSSSKITTELNTVSEMSTKSSKDEDITTTDKETWKPLSVDTSTLPPTLLFSEHEKINKNDRVDLDIDVDEDKERPSQEAQTKPTNIPIHQESVRPTVLKLRGVNACPVKEEVVAPFWANNTRGEVLALLNLYPFEQYVHWEKCTNEHKQMYCRDGCRCEQQYRLHRLLAYDPNNECRGIFSDWFRFPSCCVCKCYDVPLEYRVTSRSPRVQSLEPDEVVQRALYESAVEDWYTMDNYDDVEDFEE